MAVMTDAQRLEVSNEFQQVVSAEWSQLTSLLNTDIKAAVDAVDQWVSDNATSYNNALPTAAKTNLTASQKARLLLYVVSKRYITGT